MPHTALRKRNTGLVRVRLRLRLRLRRRHRIRLRVSVAVEALPQRGCGASATV